ncbi:hypothetical protein JCM10213_008054 [Rhodosporidiobolus nylandii]
MALTQSVLPAPLRLKPSQTIALAATDARSSLSHFLASPASALLAGSGAVRASLVRLAEGLKDELDAAPAPVLKAPEPSLAPKEDDKAKKKRRKSEGKGDGEGKKKKRKVEA